MRFFFCGCSGGLWTLWLRSVSGFLVGVLSLGCFFRKEKTGRRFCRGGGELRGVGEEAGLDRSTSSENIAEESFGLEEGGSELSRVGEEFSVGEEIARRVFT